ncbi:MAG TPA: serine/threonine-protein kinase [Pirellulaceae bacterium]|nr:serine/threonine-protein kinase [Pirellulaceae bacterium]HMO92837.1 serine/threonine-protein kinase [Pirellulaceae bacterium]HMP69421.1 serine/threonine-protein kinase [Pirellulaceae bacterium]
MSSSQDFLGPYRLIRLIRSGRRCNVWEAQRSGEQERVACKVVLEEFREDKSEIAQMRNEAMVGKEMDSPYVIKVFEFVNHRTPFIVMQLFNAKNLKQEIRERPDFVAVNIPSYIERCALGLEHLHSKGWLHCDVKPDNYLVDEQGNVKLIDFSIAKPIKGQKSVGLMKIFGKKNIVQGTRSYMSPEQILGKKLTIASDVYGFGCVLHELFSGKPPFTGVSSDDLLQKHLRAAPPSLQALNRSISEPMANLVLRMLSKDPKKRPANMSDFLSELKRTSVYRAGMRPKLNQA